MTTAWGTGALSLSPCPPLNKGRGRDRIGGDEKAADPRGTRRNQAETGISSRATDFQRQLSSKNLLDLRWKTNIPDSFVGAGDKGGAESFMGAESEDSLASSLGASQSDFRFSEPIAGFI